MESRKIEFPANQGVKLSAHVDEPDPGVTRGIVLLAHCFTCSKNLRAVGHISRTLTEHGIGVFRFGLLALVKVEGTFRVPASQKLHFTG